MKKKVAIIANFVTLPYEKGNSRFIYIANIIDKTKYDVEIITSNFYHTEKTKRIINKKELEKLDYKITLIDEPGYRRNVSLKRFYSHYKFAKNVQNYLNSNEKPDIIYSAVPSLDVAEVANKFAKKNKIKFIIDIQDLWPEAFKMVLNIPVISNILFYPMKKKANRIYSSADSIIAVSDTYLERALKVNNKCDEKLSAYLGTDLEYFDKCKFNKIDKKDDIFELVYSGTLGKSYDIKNVINALKILKNNGINNLRLVLMGTGPLEEEFKQYAKQQGIDCDFTGLLDYNEMIVRMCNCKIAINPIQSGSAASIVNKVGDYGASRNTSYKYSRIRRI